MTAANSVTATYTANPTLQITSAPAGGGTVTSLPTGINCPGTCSASFAPNTPVNLTATASQGDSFTGWSGGGCAGANSCVITLTTATAVTADFNVVPSSALTITNSGIGTGSVTSSPSGINCPTACSASFANGTPVTLTAAPGTNFSFAGFTGGGCTGAATTCVVTVSTAATVNAQFGGTLNSLNHIIIFAQENRSLDHYFGALAQYWANDGYVHYKNQPFDGLPQFNPTPGPIPMVPGCDPAYPFDPGANPPETNRCKYTIPNPPTIPGSPQISSFHLVTMCLENPSPSWNESHVDWDLSNPVARTPTLDGFVNTAANDARQIVPSMNDTNGLRAMGYYDGGDLNFYYFMASTFATSDRWFSPAMSRTQINRMYLLAATSQGHAYPLSGNDPQLSSPPIFEALQNAGISWKIYIHPNPNAVTTSNGTNCPADDTTPLCLYQVSYLNMFMYGDTVINDPVLSLNLVPIAQFATDAQNGTLPQVALIEPASASGLDEHPADFDPTPQEPNPCCSVQAGAAYAEGIITSLMTSPSWKDSALLFTYDEFGGFYDHVAPQPTVSPDGIPPSDLLPGDVCTLVTGPNCDFVYTGYRVPFIAVSPFSKKNYVSHTVADSTAMLKLIEERFGIPALTARDGAQPDISTDLFDFVNPPWLAPPSLLNIPHQNQNGPCYLDQLP
jgi:phospholipase C